MPRPKRVTDNDVLDAANIILAEQGSADFTLADVARKVGLSRAALIQRFKHRENLLRLMAAREVAATRDYLATLPCTTGVEGLWQFLREIIDSMGPGEGFSARVLIAFMESRDPQLRALAAERYGLVQQAIAARIPDLDDREILARHLHAVIAGSTMQWVVTRQDDLAAYVRGCTAAALAIRFPGFSPS